LDPKKEEEESPCKDVPAQRLLAELFSPWGERGRRKVNCKAFAIK
jgi:hypothetical protein